MRNATGLILIWLVAAGVTLPQTGPAPLPKPDGATAGSGSESPVTAEDGAKAAETGAQPALPSDNAPKPQADPRDKSVTAPDAKAAPEAKPEAPGSDTAPEKAAPEEKTPEPTAPPPPPDPPPVSETPEELALCLKDLKAIGADFSEQPAIDGDLGCGIAHPVTVRRILPDVTLEPEATLRCKTALSLAQMTRDMLIPAAARAFPDKPKLSGINQASAYICRNRNSAEDGKISEHAYGNAIDIAGLKFGDEDTPMMVARQDDGTPGAAFQRAFNALACLYFTTVLSPGSDATHQDHMHLDVIERKSGFRYCR
jgi:hypothetical protein